MQHALFSHSHVIACAVPRAQLSFTEFMSVIPEETKRDRTEDDLHDIFDAVDVNGSGDISMVCNRPAAHVPSVCCLMNVHHATFPHRA